MTDENKNDQDPIAGSCKSKVAWPGRAVNMLLGPSKKAAVSHRGFRYPACAKCASSVGMLNLIANTFLMIIKGYLGVVGHSTALVADAIHSSADVVSSIMLVFGLKIAAKPKDKKYPYGYGKVEFLVAVVIYSSLILAGIVILIDAITCIIHTCHTPPSTATLFGALISIVVNEVMFRQSVCAGAQLKSPSMIANAWEKRGDALSSVAVFLGIAGAKLGCEFMDPLAAIIVAGYILKTSAEGIMDAVKGLLDTSLDQDSVKVIRAAAGKVEGVLGIHTMRTREIGQVAWVDLEILVDGQAELGEISEIKKNVKKAVTKGLGRKTKVVVYLKPVPNEAG